MKINGIAQSHQGYHGPRGRQRFFEGWYYRLSLPTIAESFVTIYSIEDPQGGSPFSQGGIQVLGRAGLLVETLPQVSSFWAARERLAFGQVQGTQPLGELDSEKFWEHLTTGYQASATVNQGRICTTDGQTASWDYQITPITGWGRDQATMGLLSYLPVYEVGWQICMAHGWATGWFAWQEKCYQFTQAPVYIEKNWGLGYPSIWFWLQCNSFTISQGAADPNLTLTSGGGLRKLLSWADEAAMIGLHYQGRFYDFRPETGRVRWVTYTATQTTWQLWGAANGYEILITAEVATAELHTLLGPSLTDTLHPISRHSLVGSINLRLYRGRGSQAKLCLQAHSDLAAVEVGGDEWQGSWAGQCGT